MAVTPFTPTWLERLVRRCLEKDPEDLYQSMRDLVMDLRSPHSFDDALKQDHWVGVLSAYLVANLRKLNAVSVAQCDTFAVDTDRN